MILSKEPEIEIKKIIVDGQVEKDWKELMESSQMYIALVTEGFYDNIDCIEQTLYAKNQNIPTIIIHHNDVIPEIPDLFKGMNIIERYNFNDSNKDEVRARFNKKILEIKKERTERK